MHRMVSIVLHILTLVVMQKQNCDEKEVYRVKYKVIHREEYSMYAIHERHTHICFAIVV